MPPVRGLQGWLNSQDLIHDSQIEILKGSTIAIDGNKFFQSQLPRDIWSEATGSVIPETIISMVNEQIDLFIKHNITPIFVFPGVSSSAKLATALDTKKPSSNRSKKKNNATVDFQEDFSWALQDKFANVRDKAWEEFNSSRKLSSESYFAQLDPNVTTGIKKILISQLKARNCSVFSTPYRVPAQLSLLSRPPQKVVHSCLGSIDLLLYGVERVILELDIVEGVVQWVQLSEVLTANNFSHRLLVEACILAGYGACQTFPSVYDERKRFSFSRAVALLNEHKSIQVRIGFYQSKNFVVIVSN